MRHRDREPDDRSALKFDVIKHGEPPFPRFTTPGPVSRHLDRKGYEATTGIGPDLFQAVATRCAG